jgi:hypothetical protein
MGRSGLFGSNLNQRGLRSFDVRGERKAIKHGE